MTIEIGLLIAAVSLVIGYLSYALNRSREIKSEGRQGAETNTKLEYISKGVDDIRIDIKANERQMIVLGERITRVEESSKQAHKRLDTLEKETD
ncbi:hypothetical protein WBS46_16890 [Bacillus albus]|uniref:hypothetical protein n=1 Tax=Bacillus albus TaxID=2026189 RepID=UPI000B4B61B9|nr:hypothetical protein [Bacillus albus]RXJ19850.1 hypothetical protein ETJ91_00320 [Bacillus albus]RXJ30073.1 hypothetical protein ETJ76_15770 [Bacillus albus]RXJ31665.1 hypothetical protein ETJ90_08545 [Bacillus albus]RXJ42889.1 hypothetical protein ETJ89_08550 [Bacillus albus]RXJ59817.1 hypothetical protein ETJ66_08545 [Bacillus albus]